MGNSFKDLSTSTLEKRWELLRQKIMSHNEGLTDMDELISLRREIDRRKGIRNPTVDVNFEDYVKD